MSGLLVNGKRCLPGLSLRQPWAWAVVHAGKDVENRGRNTAVRGPIVIQAAKGCEPGEYREACEWMVSRGLARSPLVHSQRCMTEKLLSGDPDCLACGDGPRTNGAGALPVIPALEDLPRGVLVGVADLWHVIAPECERPPRWKMDGKFGYQLRNVRPCEHREWRGMPGWFPVPLDEIRTLNKPILEIGPMLRDQGFVRCAVCSRPVERVETMMQRGVVDESFTFRAHCHGAVDEVTITAAELMNSPREGMQSFIAFATKTEGA